MAAERSNFARSATRLYVHRIVNAGTTPQPRTYTESALRILCTLATVFAVESRDPPRSSSSWEARSVEASPFKRYAPRIRGATRDERINARSNTRGAHRGSMFRIEGRNPIIKWTL